MRVKITASLARIVDGVITSYTPGKSYDVDDALGAAWVAAGVAVAEEEPEPTAEERLDALTKAQLKAEAEARGLAVSGSKGDLVARILEHDAAQPDDDDPEPGADGGEDDGAPEDETA